jgi:hypothetical protein
LPPPPRPVANRPPPASPQPPRHRSALTANARRFLAAFLDYEVGKRDPAIARELRATATPVFAAELLGAPARRSPTGSSATAKLGPLALARVSSDPPLAVVSATAERPTGPEQLSFVFELTDGRWLASAPGE